MRRFTKHIPSHLALDLRNLRLERGLDQAQVAQEIANLAGVPELFDDLVGSDRDRGSHHPALQAARGGEVFLPQ